MLGRRVLELCFIVRIFKQYVLLLTRKGFSFKDLLCLMNKLLSQVTLAGVAGV